MCRLAPMRLRNPPVGRARAILSANRECFKNAWLNFSGCWADITPPGVTPLPFRVPQGLYASWGDLNLVLLART